jgi:hypothetical protein
MLLTLASENPPRLRTTARRDYRLKMLGGIGSRRASQKNAPKNHKKRPHERNVFSMDANAASRIGPYLQHKTVSITPF